MYYIYFFVHFIKFFSIDQFIRFQLLIHKLDTQSITMYQILNIGHNNELKHISVIK